MFVRVLTVALLALSALAPGARAADVPQSREQITLSFAPVVERTAPAVVNIYAERVVRQRRGSPLMNDPVFRHFFGDMFRGRARERVERSLGSGVIVDDGRGVVVTNQHVIEGAEKVKVVLADRRERAAERGVRGRILKRHADHVGRRALDRQSPRGVLQNEGGAGLGRPSRFREVGKAPTEQPAEPAPVRARGRLIVQQGFCGRRGVRDLAILDEQRHRRRLPVRRRWCRPGPQHRDAQRGGGKARQDYGEQGVQGQGSPPHPGDGPGGHPASRLMAG